MLNKQGIDTITYCGERFDGDGDHVPVFDAADVDRWFNGPWDTGRVFDRWDPDDPCWAELNLAIVAAMDDRVQPGDVVGLTMGRCQETIVNSFPGLLALEVGVGYEGVLEPTHHAYESSTWRHYVYGTRRWDGRNFDTVIPNAFDPADYSLGDDRGYLLFLGRHTPRKGTEVIRELAKTHRVVTAGQDGPVDGCDYFGVVVADEKRELLAHATAVLAPTLYVEPFGGVAVEAMMSGIPAITTDFGAFTETVLPEFRSNTLAEFHHAIDGAPARRGAELREQTAARFGLEPVGDR